MVAPLLGLTSVLIAVDSAWRRPGVPSGIGPGHGIPALPGAALVFAVQNFMGGVVYPIEAFNFIVALGFIFLVVAALPRLGIGYACYALIFFLVPLSRYMPGFALMSFSRYVLVLFPCFLMLALWARRRKLVHLTVIFLFLWWLLVWAAEFYTGYFVG